MGTKMLSVLLVGAAVLPACKGNETEGSTAPPPTKSAADGTQAGKVYIDPHKTAAAEAAKTPMVRTHTGTFDLDVDGELHHLTHLPFGENKALHYEGKRGVISVTAAADAGYPRAKIVMTGWRLDQLEFPITLNGTEKESIVTFRYEVGPKGPYTSDSAATLRGDNHVTLTKFEGDRLEGTFEATVAPKVETIGPPVKISGKFSTTLRLNGVERSDAADGNKGSDPDEARADPAGPPVR